MVLVNGEQSAMVGCADRGLAYGDGVFRTLRLQGGRPLSWRRHLAKLQSDCAALAIDCPSESDLEADVLRIATEEPDGVAKILVTRGEGRRGYAFTPGMSPTRVVSGSPLPVHPCRWKEEGVRVHLCSLRLAAQPRLAGIKHLNRLENVLARAEWDDPEIAEGILLDAEGNAIGGTMTNLFVAAGNALHTPDLSRCGVAGVQRERIFDAARRQGVPVHVGPLALSALYAAEEVLLCNSVIGVWTVRALGDRSWAPGVFAARVGKWLDESDT